MSDFAQMWAATACVLLGYLVGTVMTYWLMTRPGMRH